MQVQKVRVKEKVSKRWNMWWSSWWLPILKFGQYLVWDYYQIFQMWPAHVSQSDQFGWQRHILWNNMQYAGGLVQIANANHIWKNPPKRLQTTYIYNSASATFHLILPVSTIGVWVYGNGNVYGNEVIQAFSCFILKHSLLSCFIDHVATYCLSRTPDGIMHNEDWVEESPQNMKRSSAKVPRKGQCKKYPGNTSVKNSQEEPVQKVPRKDKCKKSQEKHITHLFWQKLSPIFHSSQLKLCFSAKPMTFLIFFVCWLIC